MKTGTRRFLLWFLMLLLLVALSLWITACGTQTAEEEDAGSTGSGAELAPGMVDTSQYKKDPPWTVGRAGSGDVNSWMTMFSNTFRYAIEEKYGDLFENYYETGANFDPAKQISDVEDLLARDIDLLFIDPISAAALTASVEMAMEQGVPVILVSTGVQSDNYVSWVRTDNVRAGYMMTDLAAKRIDGQGKMILLTGAAGSTYAEETEQGTREALANYPDIELVGVYNANWSPVEAKAATEAAIQANPDGIDAVVAGGLMGLGAADAFLDAGLEMPVIAGDDWNGWLQKACENDIPFVGVAGGPGHSLWAVDTAVKVLQGEPVAKQVEYPLEQLDEAACENLYRDDLNDQYWAINELPEDWVARLYGK
ncbi:MAG: sugar ABC transporter substrate-binding protein [Chloroflexi bacterium]|nr:sugar ABC transporter substrate-binding protein [Chloroflexota bacterium]